MRIFEFAKIADWENRLATLASMAEPERWTNVSIRSNKAQPVLDIYMRHTFMRIFDQQKIVEADQIACFNTGLLTIGQEEIYALFTVSESYDRGRPISPENQKWWLKSWVRAGDRALTEFMELPSLADYWNDAKDLVFDPKVPVQLNMDHIVSDNLSRFPIELGGKVDPNGIPLDLTSSEEEDGPEAAPIQFNQPIPLATRNALEGAVKHSIRLAQRSYRIAVPQFYHGKIQLLLPLYLRDSKHADLALTLERNGGWYRAATALYTDWAYSHARLLARPNSEWLGGFRSDMLNPAGA